MYRFVEEWSKSCSFFVTLNRLRRYSDTISDLFVILRHSYWYNFDSNYWSTVYKHTVGKDFKFKAGYDSEVRLGWASIWVIFLFSHLHCLLVQKRTSNFGHSYMITIFMHMSFYFVYESINGCCMYCHPSTLNRCVPLDIPTKQEYTNPAQHHTWFHFDVSTCREFIRGC